jgi:hypothetical protein
MPSNLVEPAPNIVVTATPSQSSVIINNSPNMGEPPPQSRQNLPMEQEIAKAYALANTLTLNSLTSKLEGDPAADLTLALKH